MRRVSVGIQLYARVYDNCKMLGVHGIEDMEAVRWLQGCTTTVDAMMLDDTEGGGSVNANVACAGCCSGFLVRFFTNYTVIVPGGGAG